jgi:hypothetical protein
VENVFPLTEIFWRGLNVSPPHGEKFLGLIRTTPFQSIQMSGNCWQKLILSALPGNLTNLVRDTNLFMVASLNFLTMTH